MVFLDLYPNSDFCFNPLCFPFLPYPEKLMQFLRPKETEVAINAWSLVTLKDRQPCLPVPSQTRIHEVYCPDRQLCVRTRVCVCSCVCLYAFCVYEYTMHVFMYVHVCTPTYICVCTGVWCMCAYICVCRRVCMSTWMHIYGCQCGHI